LASSVEGAAEWVMPKRNRGAALRRRRQWSATADSTTNIKATATVDDVQTPRTQQTGPARVARPAGQTAPIPTTAALPASGAHEERRASGSAALLGAFGSTFVLAPACNIRVPAEDALLLRAFARTNDLSIVVELELQARGDCWEMVRPKLSADATRVYDEDNAGGASRISEALSMEVLGHVLGARLVSTVRGWLQIIPCLQ